MKRLLINLSIPGDCLKKKDENQQSLNTPYLRELIQSIKNIIKPIGSWSFDTLKAAFNWIKELFPDKKPEKKNNAISLTSLASAIKVGTVLLALAGFACLIWIAIKMAKPIPLLKKKNKISFMGKTDTVSINPEDENVEADLLESKEWLALAHDLLNEKKYRSVIRALFLASLASLSEKQLLKLEKNKSNRDYQKQVSFYGRRIVNLPETFSQMVLMFEMIWYGNRQIEQLELDEMFLLHKTIGEYAKQ